MAESQVAGVLAFFPGSHELVEAARKTREAGWKNYDCYTPFPVHGLDDAMGIKRSPIPYVTFVAGLTGTASAFALQYWTSAVDWAVNIGGKPFNSWPAFVPVMFELTVLFAGLATFAAMLFFNRLPNLGKKVYDQGVTRDRFAIVIEASGDAHGEDRLDAAKASEFLKRLGGQEVRSVYAEGWF